MENPQRVLTELMDTYGDGVWQYIYSLVKDVHTAQDLAQEVFLNAYNNLSQFRGQSSVKTWLFAIAHNKCRDYFRSALIRRVIPVSEHDVTADARGIEEDIVRHQEYHEVLHELLLLDRKYREVVVLHIHESMTFREIAQALGISESTVKTRYNRAVKRLRNKIQQGALEHDN